jgi:transposase-like protein
MNRKKNSQRYQRERRYFSEDFRRARVKEYEEGQVTVAQISRTYQVSETAVYKWIEKYSLHYQKSIVKVVEEKSETKKRQALEKQVAELEQLIGQQQVKLQYYEKMLDLLKEQYGVDFEKNCDGKSWNGSSPSGKNTH